QQPHGRAGDRPAERAHRPRDGPRRPVLRAPRGSRREHRGAHPLHRRRPMTALWLTGVVAVAFLVLLVWTVAWRRALSRRLGVLAARLDDDGGALSDGRGVEATLTALERAADEAGLRVDRTTSAAERLAQALDALHQGVVLCDEEGSIAYRNLL